jgi:hypothetical protein
LAEAEAFAGGLEHPWAVARAIIRHHALDPDTQPGIIGDSGLQEGDRTFFALIGHHLDEGNAWGIVDADVDELPADAMMAIERAGIATADAMSHRADAAKLFDVEVDQLTRVLALWTGTLHALPPLRPSPKLFLQAEPSGGAADKISTLLPTLRFAVAS